MVFNSPVSHIHFHNLKQTDWKTACQEKWRVGCWLSTLPFSFPEVVLLLVRTKNHELWLDPIFWTCTECSCSLYSQSIRFIRLDRKFVNRWLTVLDQCRDCNSWCADSGDKNGTLQEQIIHKVFLFTSSNQQCSSRKYPYLPLWKFWLSFMHFGLTKTPIPSVGEVWIFSGTESVYDRLFYMLDKIFTIYCIEKKYLVAIFLPHVLILNTKTVKFHFRWGTKLWDQKQKNENDYDIISGLKVSGKTDFSDIIIFIFL